MRLQVLALCVLAAAAAVALPSRSDEQPHEPRHRTRLTRSPTSSPGADYSSSTTNPSRYGTPRAEVSNKAARRGARGRLRAVDSVEVLQIQHWPPLDTQSEAAETEDARQEKHTFLEKERRKSKNDWYKGNEFPEMQRSRSQPASSKNVNYSEEESFNIQKSVQIGSQRRSWSDDSQPKPRKEKRFWTKPIRVEEAPEISGTTESVEDWSERISASSEAPPRTEKNPIKDTSSAEDRSDWTGRQPTPAEIAQLSNLATKLKQQIEKEHQQHMMSLEQRQSIQQQEMQQTLQEQRQQQVMQQNLQMQTMHQKLQQQTMQQKHQMAMQQQQASAAVTAVAAAVGGRGRQARGGASLVPLVEVEVVEAGADDEEESVARRWGNPHEQQVHVVKVAVPQPVPVPIPQPVPVAVPHPVPVRVKVAEHIEVPVVRTVAVPVETPVPVKVEHLIPYPVEKPVPVPIEKHVPYPVHEPYPVKVPVVKTIHHYLKKVKKGKKKKGGKHHHHHHHRHHDHDRRRRRRRHHSQQRHRQERRRLRNRRRMRKIRRLRPSD